MQVQVSAEERARIIEARMQDERAIIFSNLLNGVPASEIARAHRKSEKEVADIFNFVLRKIRSYCFERRLPQVIACSVAEVAKRYRVTCLEILPKINLGKDPKFPKILDETMTIRRDGTLTNEDVLRNMTR